jgi:uncharacterized damage-inducible protein DinB
MGEPEVWLRGPIDGIDAYLQPAAHALVQAREDLMTIARSVPPDQLWSRPGGAASVGFHVRHAAGALERLLVYARGEQLTPEQAGAARAEKDESPGLDAAAVIEELRRSVDKALLQLKATKRDALLQPREVGRGRLPSTVMGLIFHAAEHAQRHAGQAITTAKALGVG